MFERVLVLKKQGEDSPNLSESEGREQANFERGAGSDPHSGAGDSGQCIDLSEGASGSVLC